MHLLLVIHVVFKRISERERVGGMEIKSKGGKGLVAPLLVYVCWRLPAKTEVSKGLTFDFKAIKVTSIDRDCIFFCK